MTTNAPLNERQIAIGCIAASTATGDMARLNTALNLGLDAGLTISEAKEVLVQLYAYAGFPRALNALTELMSVLQTRRNRGLKDAPGRDPMPLSPRQSMLDVGTENQTRLSGAPVRGALFEFAPVIDQFLKSHLFGDIFARDNLDWANRELATVGALSAMTGVDTQLQAHIRISMNAGLTAGQLDQFARALTARGDTRAGNHLLAALGRRAEAHPPDLPTGAASSDAVPSDGANP